VAKRAPKHLQPATRRWWSSVVGGFELDEHHIKLLTLAAEALDRANEATARIAKDGAYITDRFGQLKAHPACAVERDAAATFARLLRELDLDTEQAPEAARPPMLRRYSA